MQARFFVSPKDVDVVVVEPLRIIIVLLFLEDVSAKVDHCCRIRCCGWSIVIAC